MFSIEQLLRMLAMKLRPEFFVLILITIVVIGYKVYYGGSGYTSTAILAPEAESANVAASNTSNGRNQAHKDAAKMEVDQPEAATTEEATTAEATTEAKSIIKRFHQKLKEGTIFYQEVLPTGKSKLDVVLLHGQSFTSQNWITIKTLEILASSGYRALAIDLPGYGKSTYKVADRQPKKLAALLAKFLKTAKIASPVVISPSMSGQYSLPFVVAEKVSGYVPIAIAATDKYTTDEFKQFTAPTLILRGSKDSHGKMATDNLQKLIPHAKTSIIEGAGHACYLDKPDEFHKILVNFLDSISQKKESA